MATMSSGDGEDLPMMITESGARMAQELQAGHNSLAYLCSERPEAAEFAVDELCVICSDGFEAIMWKTRALEAGWKR
jgi:hypothetical protein